MRLFKGLVHPNYRKLLNITDECIHFKNSIPIIQDNPLNMLLNYYKLLLFFQEIVCGQCVLWIFPNNRYTDPSMGHSWKKKRAGLGLTNLGEHVSVCVNKYITP